MALLLANELGVASGLDTGSVAFKPAGKPAGNTRIAGTGSAEGNRSSITLKVPD